ncbi:MAG: hypothetical protein KatS3mg057_1984 [Herpetosiphonaceae bacterium]|nr:MAG: hypothetical protein KatS3mg057_1984 [Herpetosiphonaceae bacterium]
MLEILLIEATIIVILIIANGFFAASEIAIVSARRNRLQQEAEAGRRGARQALDLIQDPDRFLATIQVGITLIGTFAAAFGGAHIADILALWLSAVPSLAPYADTLALAMVVIAITYLSLVLGELVPKRLALQYAERIAMGSAPLMARLAVIAGPVIALLIASVNLVLRLLRQSRATRTTVTAEDIVSLAHEGAASGTVEREELQFIERVFEFSDRPVRAAMTPRTEITAIEVGTPLTTAVQIFLNSGYSRLPVYQESLDHIVGVLYAKDLLQLVKVEEDADIQQLVRPPTYVLEYQHVGDMLGTFRRQGSHLALVVDEYGQVTGLITLEDVLEELVGEIQDEYDLPSEPAFVQRQDGSWLVDAMEPYDTVRERIGLPEVPEEERREYTTLAGLMLARLGRIPQVGDSVILEHWVLEVVDMDGRRIDKILVKYIDQQQAAAEGELPINDSA